MPLDQARPASLGAYGEASEDAHGGDAEASDATASLHPDLWRAMVSETPGVRWYMDHDTLTILRVGLADGHPLPPVADAPGRFAEIPTLPTDRQRAHARRVLSDLVGTEEVAWLTGGEPWLRHFHENASAELRQALSDARRAWVVAEVRAWLHAHDLPEHRFVRSARPPARDLRGGRMRSRNMSLREAVHHAIDRMTERELEALPIPARLLLDD